MKTMGVKIGSCMGAWTEMREGSIKIVARKVRIDGSTRQGTGRKKMNDSLGSNTFTITVLNKTKHASLLQDYHNFLFFETGLMQLRLASDSLCS